MRFLKEKGKLTIMLQNTNLIVDQGIDDEKGAPIFCESIVLRYLARYRKYEDFSGDW